MAKESAAIVAASKTPAGKGLDSALQELISNVPAVKRVLVQARERGFVTHDEINAALPEDELYLEYGDRAWYGLRPPPGAGDLWDSALSRDGQRIAVLGEGGLYWCDAVAVCPSWTRVEAPDTMLADDTTITWTDQAGRLVPAHRVVGQVRRAAAGGQDQEGQGAHRASYGISNWYFQVTYMAIGRPSTSRPGWKRTRRTRSTAISSSP